MLENPEALAIGQDPLGAQGRLISAKGPAQVWVKPLAGGGRAVALFNRGSDPVRISITASAIGLPRARGYKIRDVWRRTTHRTNGPIGAVVAPATVALYRVTRA
jgi:alpha-galactosidase